jgi:hypothetical protein
METQRPAQENRRGCSNTGGHEGSNTCGFDGQILAVKIENY